MSINNIPAEHLLEWAKNQTKGSKHHVMKKLNELNSLISEIDSQVTARLSEKMEKAYRQIDAYRTIVNNDCLIVENRWNFPGEELAEAIQDLRVDLAVLNELISKGYELVSIARSLAQTQWPDIKAE